MSSSHQAGPGDKHRYLPALDGLRAVAVAAVVAYHLPVSWARGGYLGVDLFFVLSGFLITGLLVAERQNTGRVSLRRFYSRRARRLLPALLLVLTVTSIWVGLSGSGIDIPKYRGDVIAALGYVANWRFVLSHQGYFDQFTTPSPIRHMWSLAIEEQFYLLWPMMLLGFALLRNGSRRVVAVCTALLALGSLALMVGLYSPGHDPSRVYYGTDTRAFELLIGALLALAVNGTPEPGPRLARFLDGVGVLSLAGLIWMMVAVPDTAAWMYRGGMLLTALLAAATIWSVGRVRPGPLGRILSAQPLRWTGQVSYGIYLWHWPVIVLLTAQATKLSGNTLHLVHVALAIGIAAASYYVLERPIRQGWLPGRQIWVAAPTAVAAAVAALLWATALPVSASSGAGTEAAASSSDALPPLPAGLRLPLGLVRVPTAESPLRVLLVGDSLMMSASPGIKAALEATGVARVDDQAVLGFGLTKTFYAWRTIWPKMVAKDHTDIVIAMFGGWDQPLVASKGPAWYGSQVDDAVAALGSRGARVVFLEYPRSQPPSIPGQKPPNLVEHERRRLLVNSVFVNVSRRHAGKVAYLPLSRVVDLNGRYSAFLPGADGTLQRTRRHDNTHFCPPGAERVGGWVLKELTLTYHLHRADPAWTRGPWRTAARWNIPRDCS